MYFLLAYRRTAGRIIERHSYPSADLDRAWRQRDAWIAKYIRDPDVEVVLLGADSLDDLKVTHGRYFQSDDASLTTGR